MEFCTVINCMDGRIQLPVINYLQDRFNVEFVDSITEAGPNLILAEQNDQDALNSILSKLEISVNTHNSKSIAIVGHHDCAGNPSPKKDQIEHIKKSIRFLEEKFENITILGLWVDDKWQVNEIHQQD